MSSIQEKITRNFHWIFIGNILYGAYEGFEKFQTEFNDINESAPRIHLQIKKTKKKIRQIKKFHENLETSKARVVEIETQVSELKKSLPSKISDGELLDLFSSEADIVNILKVHITPGREEDKGAFFAKSYIFTGSGTYLQFMIFFERLSSVSRIINVTDLELSLAEGDQRGKYTMLKMKAMLEVFRYKQSTFKQVREK